MPVTLEWSSSTIGAENTLVMWRTKLNNPQPAFKEMARAMAGLQKEWFATEGKGTWAPLSPQYAAWKRKKYPRRKILHGPDRPGHQGGQLRDQLTKQPFGYQKITRTEFVYGSTLKYSKYHRLGSGRLPRRDPLVPLNTATVAMLDRIIQGHLDSGMGGI